MIIHLNGWPGVGKKTIGAILAKNLGARFVHNHLLHDVAIVCAGLNTPARWTLYEEVRAAAYSTLSQLSTNESLVMTNALCKHAQRELEAWKHVVELAVLRNVPLVPVVLEVEMEENFRRLESLDRVGNKMTDTAELRGFFSADTIQYPDVPELLTLDITYLDPEEAAAQIENHLNYIGPKLQSASRLHLKLR